MSNWQTTPLELPIDGVPCWVRLNYWFGQPFRATYNVATEEWTSTVNGLTYPVWSISRWKYEFDGLVALLTPVGTGAGVNTLRFRTDVTQTIYLDGAARFYTDSGGTLGESTEWTVTAGALRTIYMKCTTGTANMYIPLPGNLISWGDISNWGWVTGSNGLKITLDLVPTGFTFIQVQGYVSISGNLPSTLIQALLASGNIIWSSTNPLPSVMTYIYFDGSQSAWTYGGALPSGLTYIYMNCSTGNWTYNQILGSANFSTFNMSNYRVSKMSSANMVILLDSMRTKTGTFPATVTINDYADYAAPPAEVTAAVAALKAAKSITTVNLGA